MTGGVPWVSLDSTAHVGHPEKGLICNPEVDEVLAKVAENLHLARHTVGDKELWCAGDIECRQAKQSKHAYLLDMARALPPRAPGRS